MAINVVDDVDAAFGFDPLICFREAGIGADDGDDAMSGGQDVAGLFEEEIENVTKISAALFIEARGVSVPV